ncbi:MAG: CBS domain-containing protein [Myxococcaceae bacterium]
MLKQVPEEKMSKWSGEEKAELAPASRGGSSRTRVSALMTKDVIFVRPETSIDTAAALLLDNGISRVPVIDKAGKLVGVLSKTDLVEEQVDREDSGEYSGPLTRRSSPGVRATEPHMHEHVMGPLVEEVMSMPALCVPEHYTVARAAEIMAAHRVHGLPVVKPTGELVGMISALDILAWVAGMT